MRYRRCNILKQGLSMILTAMLMTGCGERETVDYSIEGVAESEQPQEEGGKSGLAQFEGEEVWKDTWLFETDETFEWEGQIFSLHNSVDINASIIVPQVKQMSVIEAEEPVFDVTYKQTIAERLFEDGAVYYNDENAKGTYIPVEEYSVNEYIGTYDGQLYTLTFTETEGSKRYNLRRSRQIIWEAEDIYEICPEKYIEVEELECSPWMRGDWAENGCVISEEEALKEAQLFAEKIGLDYPVVSHTRPLLWGTPPKIGIGESENWGINGYVFSFDLGVDNLSFLDYGVEEDYESYWFDTKEDEVKAREEQEIQYCLQARMQVYVTDKGVIRIVANNPMELVGVSEGVELLPLDSIKGMMEETVEKEWDTLRFYHNNGKTFNEMELIYFRVGDKEEPGKYSYVPTWRLGQVTRDAVLQTIVIERHVLINAIDGSFINYYDET